ncbi:MAG: acyl-CoA desaturase [Prosthecobacter sp.]|nr:acyl-CoA desaturase [Prosthecobacter sp.]
MRPESEATNPLQGRVVWSPVKSLWFTGHALAAVIGGWLTLGAGPVLIAFSFTVLTLCLGHTIGLHRLLVHRSFACPRWWEYALVHLGTVVGMGGPFRILYMHDIRDWAQRHPESHPFFTDASPLWKDFLWQMHGEMRLDHPPRFEIEQTVGGNPVHRFLQRTWMLQQLPWAVLFYALAGVGGMVWGISVRITVSLTGHWLIGWLAHNVGHRDWHLQGHAVQGYNLPHLGLITMGEGWHNNHHAFPESARLGLRGKQHDPGWWAIRTMHACGLAWDVKEPANLPERPERVPVEKPPSAKPRASAFFNLGSL